MPSACMPWNAYRINPKKHAEQSKSCSTANESGSVPSQHAEHCKSCNTGEASASLIPSHAQCRISCSTLQTEACFRGMLCSLLILRRDAHSHRMACSMLRTGACSRGVSQHPVCKRTITKMARKTYQKNFCTVIIRLWRFRNH